jgi:hypothetical protein
MVINHIDTRRSGGMHTVAQLAAQQLWGAALCTHSVGSLALSQLQSTHI